MSKLPVVSGQDCLKALSRAGFTLRRQQSSHMILRRDEPFCQVVVPDHKVLDRGTPRSILRAAGLSPEQFERLLS